MSADELLDVLTADGQVLGTKRRADVLAKSIARSGYTVDRIHANRSQNQRQQALEGFKTGKYRVLVATDIAARGIDVAEIGHVVNFDLPHVPEDYVHRVGRTARASASGHASAFCAPEEMVLLRDIEKLIRGPVPRRPIPREAASFEKALASEKTFRAQPGNAVRQDSRPQRGQQRSSRQQTRGARAGAHRGGSGGGGGGSSAGGQKSSGKTLFSGGPGKRR